MPELPEVETVRRGLEKALKGKRIRRVVLRRGSLRFPIPEELPKKVAGKRVVSVRRRAKYLLLDVEGGEILLAHLGMSGRMLVHEALPTQFGVHDHVVFECADGTTLVFNDARRFGMLLLTDAASVDEHPMLKDLGPEPFGRTFTPRYLSQELVKRSGPIKTVLMDQKLVVGVGNIYASEALFCARISPKAPASRCASQAATLATCIRKVLKAAIASGGSTLRDYVRADGDIGDFQHQFLVYGREGKSCMRCRGVIHRIVQAGRSTFFCPRCQK